MFEHLAHERLIDLGGGDEAIHLGRVVQLFERGFDVGIAGRWLEPGLFEEILPVDDHLGPAVGRYRGETVVELRHLQRAGREGGAAKFLDHVGGGIWVEDPGLGPRQGVGQRVVDDIGHVACGEGGGGTGAHLAFGDRDHLDLMAGRFGEGLGHRLLLGQPLGLLFDGPEPDGVGLGHPGGQRQRHGGAAENSAFDGCHRLPPDVGRQTRERKGMGARCAKHGTGRARWSAQMPQCSKTSSLENPFSTLNT